MSEEKYQFDKHIGGPVDLPYAVDFMTFAKHRAQEILALTQAIDDPQRTGLTFQQLPRHMRRRVMGHTSKRLPRALQEAHRRQLEKSGMPPPSKRPSRCHRRRPTNLLAEYNRRQREFAWLETHIWHAKRFHMVDKWGYKIANFPNDKSFRACYRATSKHCLLQDLSYFACVELTGVLGRLMDGLKHHTSQDCGLTFGARYFLNGLKEGNLTFFRRSEFPYGAIGNVSFLWKSLERETTPDEETSHDTRRTLWVWIHPAFYQEVLDELTGTFEMEMDITADINVAELDLDSKDKKSAEPKKKKPRLDKKVEETKLLTRNVPFKKTPKYRNENGIEMVLLKGTLNRFRLTGPLSQAILSQALQLVNTSTRKPLKIKAKKPPKAIPKATTVAKVPLGNIAEIFARMYDEPVEKKRDIEPVETSSDEEEAFSDCKTRASDVKKPNDWWTEFYSSNSYHRASLDAQKGLWESLSGVLTPAQLPAHIVIGLTVKDPRLSMPAKRKKALPDDSKPWQQALPAAPELLRPSVCASAIWCPSVRDSATQTKRSVAELNRDRAKYLVPGDVAGTDACHGQGGLEMAQAPDHSRIPVLAVQRPGSQSADVKRLGFGCGWDLVLPAGWGMPMWMSLVFRGARAGGLRETEVLERERSVGGALLPDAAAGRREADARRDELREKHFRLPPDKRPNYLKLGISSPFSCPWDVLVREWIQDSPPSPPQSIPPTPSPFFVLRHKKTLWKLRDAVNAKKTQPAMTELSEISGGLSNCIVPVALSMVRKGTPVDFSIICLPSDEDLKEFSKDRNCAGPLEQAHKDVNCKERKDLRSEHKALLKRLRKRRVERKRRAEEAAGNDGANVSEPPAAGKRKPSEPSETVVVEEYARASRALWLPEAASVKAAASRPTVGYVTRGDFAFTEASGAATGYVALAALVRILAAREDSRRPVYVLVRNPTSYQYRFAKLDVMCLD